MLGNPDLDRPDAERVEHFTMLRNAPWSARTPTWRDRIVPATSPDRHSAVELVDLVARIASPRPRRPWRRWRDRRSGWSPRRSPCARRRIVALEDARADEHRLRAELHHERGVGGRGDPARAEQRNRELAELGDLVDELDRRPQLLGPREQLGLVGDGELRMSPRIERRCRTASTMLPVPASPFERIRHAPSAMRRSASPRLVAPHTNGHGERPLVDVVRLVGGGEHLALVDVVDAERLEDLRLGEVADAALRHDRDGHRGLDALDHRRVAHAGDAAVAADVGRHALERHDRDRAGVLGDRRLLGVTTSMMTPPRSISARPRFTRAVPVVRSRHATVYSISRSRTGVPIGVAAGLPAGRSSAAPAARGGHDDRPSFTSAWQQLDPRPARRSARSASRRRRGTGRAAPSPALPAAFDDLPVREHPRLDPRRRSAPRGCCGAALRV